MFDTYVPGTSLKLKRNPHWVAATDPVRHDYPDAWDFNWGVDAVKSQTAVLNSNGPDANTLNYDIRVLGREGVLSFNAVAGMSQLSDIEGRMKEVMSFADFRPGQRYADYKPGTDRTAAYGSPVGSLRPGWRTVSAVTPTDEPL